ncbi:hypothetical protein BLNAU_18199 [Blattamonas nauphoetae]|uniref:Uncharacterized protein n=1 Tax=Blattamonas nauphoetae TaxID=2049346 RepID=A0ABQ9X9M1_9EUKA|nr:hypothetical protein BLNAU_18199 [Blattamonas nauphoetae]
MPTQANPALSKSSDPIRGPVPKIKSPSRSSIEVPVIETDGVQPSVLSVPSNRPCDAVPSVSPIQQTTNGEHSMFERIEHNDTTTQDPNTRAVPTPSTPQSNSNDHRQTELFLNTNIVSNPTTFPSNLPITRFHHIIRREEVSSWEQQPSWLSISMFNSRLQCCVTGIIPSTVQTTENEKKSESNHCELISANVVPLCDAFPIAFCGIGKR